MTHKKSRGDWNSSTRSKVYAVRLLRRYVKKHGHKINRDEARHGKAFAGLLERYFGK